jgi:WD40 repeat protein/serine/threonine protein kinase
LAGFLAGDRTTLLEHSETLETDRMTNRAQAVKEIFLNALEIVSDLERETYLRNQCRDDAELRHEVDALLLENQRIGQFLETEPIFGPAAATERPGDWIGPYKLLEPIGEGGFGVVYLAEQTTPVKREVALKLIKPGMDTRQVIARFEAERQALAIMDHPNIAKVFDAGTVSSRQKAEGSRQKAEGSEQKAEGSRQKAEGSRQRAEGSRQRAEHAEQTAARDPRAEDHDKVGLAQPPNSPLSSALGPLPTALCLPPTARPYFVMELVRGVPITDYCDRQRLSIRERLGLFLDVCDAVHHAHQKGIIHRDLKPTNALVSGKGDKSNLCEAPEGPFRQIGPVPFSRPLAKVIDFGVAKAIGGQQLTDKTLLTGFAQLIGTPTYMSPEQTALSADIDTRCDVYALGVMLYELLTGTTPFDKDRLRQARYDEMCRIIAQEEPPRPSTRIGTLETEKRSIISGCRRIDPRRFRLALRGELDWIVMKCLEKDRDRRYESASALAADLERYLGDEPVLARPASRWRVCRKWCRRHPAWASLIVAATAFLLLLSAGMGWHTTQLQHALQTSERLRQDLALREHRLREEAYAADMSLVWQARQTGNLEHARTLLARHVPESGEPDLRGFEWRYLARRCQPELLTYTGHSAGILCADISPDDRWIASGDIGGAVKIWDLETGAEVRSLRHSDKEVCAVRFHPHRPLLATAGQLDMVRLWNLEDGTEAARVIGHDGTVCSLAWSPDGTRLASASRDGFIVVWDATTPSATKVIARLEHGDVVRCVAWSPDGKLVAGATTDAADNGEVWLWETGRWQPAGKLVGHDRGFVTLAFDPTGCTLASGGYSAHTILFDVAERRELERHRHETNFRSVWSLAFIPGISGSRSDLVAGLSGDGLVWWTALGTAGEFAQLPTNINHAGKLRAIQPTRKADRLLTASQHDRTLKLWETGALRNYAIAARIPSRTLALDASRDRSAGFAENDGALWLFAASQGKKLLRLGADTTRDPVRAAAFSPDGKSLATAQGTGRICIGNLKSGECRALVTGPPLDPDIDIRLLFSPDGKVLAIGQADRGVRLLDVDTGDRQANFNIQASAGCVFAFSPDGSVLAAPISGDSADSARIVCRRTDTGKPIAILPCEHSSVEALAFSTDGTLLAAGGTRGLVVYEWRNERELVRFLPQDLIVRDVAFFPDGKTLATSVHDGSLRLWSLAAKRELFTPLRSDALRQFTRGRLTIQSATENALTVMVSTDPNRPGEILIFEGVPAEQ